MFRFVLSVAVGSTVAFAETSLQALGLSENDNVLSLNLDRNDPKVEKAFSQIYDSFLKDFDVDKYSELMEELEVGLKNYKHSNAYNGYKTIPNQPVCDMGVATPTGSAALATKAIAPFPGGMLKRLFGFDLGKMLFEISQKAAGPAAASGGMGGILAMQALNMGASMIQSMVASAVHIVPKFVPNYQPLTCMPMVSGHNCFGAVLYPITMSDFVIADVTDSMMDGYLSGFPTTYLEKVGKTSDAAYKMCGSAYMSMQCSSIFPKCNSAKAENSNAPVMGRTPMCFTHCISTLVFCPGFWIEDIMGPCQNVAPPPMCSYAVWWNFWRLPPQLASFEDSHPAPMECPKTSVSFSADSDFSLYDTAAETAQPMASPFLSGEESATGIAKLPNA